MEEEKRATDAYARDYFRGFDSVCPSVFLRMPDGRLVIEAFWSRMVAVAVEAPELIEAQINYQWWHMQHGTDPTERMRSW